MNTQHQVIDACNRIEALLASGYGATGRDVNERLDSVLSKVPTHVIKRVRHIANVRSKVERGEGVEDADLEGCLNTADFVLKELEKFAFASVSQPSAAPREAPTAVDLPPVKVRDKNTPIVSLRPAAVSQFTPISVAMLLVVTSAVFAMKDLVGIGAFLLAAAMLVMLKPLYYTFSNEYLIFDDRVVRKTGIFVTRETALPREKIITRTVQFPSLQARLFGYGTVEFASAATDIAEVIFHNVMRPKEIAEFVAKLGGRDGT